MRATTVTTATAIAAVKYGCQSEMKMAPMTGSANKHRNTGFCTPPVCCQM